MRIRSTVTRIAVAGLLLAHAHTASAQSQAQAQGSALMESMMQMATRSLGGPYTLSQPGGWPAMNPAVALNPITLVPPMMTMANPFVSLNPVMSTAVMNPFTYLQFMNPLAYAPMMDPYTYSRALGAATRHPMPTPQAYADWYAKLQASVMTPDQYRELYDRVQQSLAEAAPAPDASPKP